MTYLYKIPFRLPRPPYPYFQHATNLMVRATVFHGDITASQPMVVAGVHTGGFAANKRIRLVTNLGKSPKQPIHVALAG